MRCCAPEPQILIAWAAAADEPEIIGDPAWSSMRTRRIACSPSAPGSSRTRRRRWKSSLEALRAHGTGFATTLTTLAGRPIEAEGQVFGGRAILRLKQVDGVKRELAELQIRCQKQFDESNAMRTLIDALPSPIWARDEAGKLVFANAAYARAVDAKDGAEAVERGLELFDHAAREELSCAPTRRQRPLADGCRPSSPAAAGPSTCSPFRPGAAAPAIGIDATEAESMRAEIKRMIDAHRRTLDQLPTGVAIFGSDQRLTFYNTAYRSLWDLDAGFLDQGPTDSAVLDRLRADRKLPEEAGLPAMEGAAAGRLPRARSQGARLAPARTAARCASSRRPIRKAA